jgi:hypothetical protein
MDIKEFFEKKGIVAKYFQWRTSDGRVIRQSDLGNWAWEHAIPCVDENIENSWNKNEDYLLEDCIQPDEFDEFGVDYISICIACFGEKYVEDKLREHIRKKLKEID